MRKATRATQLLDKLGAPYERLLYDYDAVAGRIGLQAAASLGVDPAIVLKTLMAKVDNSPVVCALVPSDKQASMKRIAGTLSGRKAVMLTPADAERATGYVVGGISPFGQKSRVQVLVDTSAFEHDRVFVNGGGRGIQLRIRPQLLLELLDATVAVIVAEGFSTRSLGRKESGPEKIRRADCLETTGSARRG